MSRAATARRKQLLWAAFVLLFIAAATLAGATAVLWWRERPLRQAEAALEAGSADQARVLVDAFLADYPNNDHAQALRARVLVALGQWSEASRLFEAAGASTAEELRDWATAQMYQQRWSEALALFQRLLQLNPRDPSALRGITTCCVNLSRFEEAVESAERLAGLPGYEVEGHFLLGAAQNELGNRGAAIEAWQYVLERNPRLEGLYRVLGGRVTPQEFCAALGGTLLAEGRTAEAVELLQRACADDPSAYALVQLGDAYAQQGDPRAAEQWLHALELDPTNYGARVSLARAALEQLRPDEALQWLAPLLEGEGLNSQTAYLAERAYTLLEDVDQAEQWRARAAQLRDFERRRGVLTQAAQQDPHSFRAYLLQAYRLAEAENWMEAERLVELLVTEAPHDSFVRDLAQSVRSRGRRPLPSLERIMPADVR